MNLPGKQFNIVNFALLCVFSICVYILPIIFLLLKTQNYSINYSIQAHSSSMLNLLVFVFTYFISCLVKQIVIRRQTFFAYTIVILYSIAIFFLLVLRLQYSIYILVLGALLNIGLYILYDYLIHRKIHNIIAYVPYGDAKDINLLTDRYKWFKLIKPKLRNVPVIAIIVDMDNKNLGTKWMNFITNCALNNIQIINSHDFKEFYLGKISLDRIKDYNELINFNATHFYMYIKYLVDIFLIILLLPITSIVAIIVAICIKFDDGGSIFYMQDRVGYKNKNFKIYKFRSMSENNSETNTLDNDHRITRVGKFMRRFRIDELPQFINVIKGEMSLIGPRAEFKTFADKIEEELPFYYYRNIVKPGISGWAQVNQGYAIDVEESKTKLAYDLFYIKNFSFLLDVIIVIKTIKTIFSGFGAR